MSVKCRVLCTRLLYWWDDLTDGLYARWAMYLYRHHRHKLIPWEEVKARLLSDSDNRATELT